MKLLLACLGIALSISSLPAAAAVDADVIVYGGTSGAVIAAVQAHKEGQSVILISPDKHLGGLSSSGLGWADVGKVSLIGGLSKEFFHRVWLHYNDPSAWRTSIVPKLVHAQTPVGKDDANQMMYVFEPKVAEAIFNQFIDENKIPVVHGRLDLKNGVEKDGKRITGVRVEDGSVFHGRMFIDASYEGDLMAKAGVSYAVGREASSQYGESINGLQTRLARKNQLPVGIDPYARKGDATSGLLPGVNPATTAPDGSGDKMIQTYCYRMCLTDDPAHRIDVAKPAGYRDEDYELLFRAIEAGQKGGFFKIDPVPNDKTDSNNSGGISTDFIGQNYDYPDADYATRDKIARAHRDWQLGLIWALQNSPRVPIEIKILYTKWGLSDDEFTDNNHWPYALYIREGRRMVGDFVLSEAVLSKGLPAQHPIGIGSYAMDSHNVQRLVGADGFVHNEGDVEKPVKHPYQIDYGVLVPKRAECENLLVTFDVSATHVAFGSVRMESVFMILSQSAATAAALALDGKLAVQDVPYDKLNAKLVADGQVLDVK
jgi:FAD dependent oxidoreductase